MPAAKDLTGKRFGRLTAKISVGSRPGQGRMWACECDCGQCVERRSADLTAGNVTSCGCAKVSEAVGVGSRFGRLRVRLKLKRQGPGHSRWACQCECGKWTVATTGNLQSGNTISCGCYREDAVREVRRAHAMTQNRRKLGH